MRIVFLSFYEAYPPASGAAAVTYNCARHASGQAFLIQLACEDAEDRKLGDLTIITVRGATNSRWKRVLGLCSRVERIVARCRDICPDVVVLEGASWAVYHWRLLKRLRQEGIGRLIVYHSHNVEHHLRTERHGRLVTAITKWAEGWVLGHADLSFAVSEVDAREFSALYGVRPRLLPNGVDVERFAAVTDSQVREIRSKYGLCGNIVLFMGLMGYQPNREAVEFLVHDVFEGVVDACPDARLALLGGEAHHERPWLVNPGSIPYDELPAFVKACDVCVAPVFSGSGTRLKILEYMAGGKPVVATAKGAEGIEVSDGQSIVLANDAGAFSMAISRILQEPGMGERLGMQGARLVAERYAWPGIMSGFRETLQAEMHRARGAG